MLIGNDNEKNDLYFWDIKSLSSVGSTEKLSTYRLIVKYGEPEER
jgi:hypothetical protein